MQGKSNQASDSINLTDLAGLSRWVAWRSVKRDGKSTKIPVDPFNGRSASSTDSTTWATRSEAESRLSIDLLAGVGVVLGELSSGDLIAGIDLDGCRDNSGALTAEAREVLRRFDSYAEISPSQRGVKILFQVAAQDLPAVEKIVGGNGKKFSQGNHRNIEIYLRHRYFTVTDDALPDHSEIRTVSPDDIRWLVREAGPAFAGEAPANESERRERDPESLDPLGIPVEEAETAINKIQDWADDRESWLRVGMALKHEFGEKAWSLFDRWSRKGQGYNKRNNRSQWRGLKADHRNPITMRTIMHEIRQRELQAEIEHMDDPADDSRDDRPKGILTFLTPDQCANAPAREYVIKGLLARGDLGCIFGPPGTGKSLIAPYLGYMVAQGRSAFAMRTRQGVAFYIAAEDETGMHGRVSALADAHGNENNFKLVGRCSDLLSENSRHLKELWRAVADQRPSLIVIDTLAMAFPGLEENSAEGMGRVVAVARSLTKHGAAVLLIHHDTKAGAETPRGHSLLNGALDVALHVQSDGTLVRARLTKNRNGTCQRDIAFNIGVVTLGTDSDGDDITAALCEPAQWREKRPPLTPKEYDVWAALSERGAIEANWRRAYLQDCDGEKDNTTRKTFRRAIPQLLRKGWVFLDGETYFPSKADRDVAARIRDMDEEDFI